MGRRGGSGGMHGVVCLVLTVLAVWPVRPLERILDALVWTTRPLLAVTGPLKGLGKVRAADGEIEQLWAAEAQESEALEGLIQEQAVPRSVVLEGGALLHAEAVGRPEGELDSLLVRVWRSGLVSRGMPVTSGDHYVGLVRSVASRSGAEGTFDDVTVELITSSKARIGAGVFAGGEWDRNSRFVVGGLLAPEDFGLGAAQVILAVHHPSRQGLDQGRVLVREAEDEGRDLAYLANGFQLGALELAQEPEERTRMELTGVRPGVDFESGLYQVLIHTGLNPEEIVEDPTLDTASLGAWVASQRVPMVDGAPWREGFKLTAGSRAGMQRGAAVASGVRLLGRVVRRGLWHGDVQGLGDRGFSVPAIALWQGEQGAGEVQATFVMGRLSAKGRDREGRLLWHWPAALARTSQGTGRALLYTGSGDPGVPRGLLIGSTRVPEGPGPHTLVIETPEEGEVWRDIHFFQFEEIQ